MVEEVLIRDPGVDAARMKVEVTEGIVELSGTANDLLSKRRASLLAQTVRGVRGVSDGLELSVPERPDQEIQRDVLLALLRDSTTESWKVQCTVKDGVVTLNGRMQSKQEQQVARRLAEGVRGVREVNDALVLDLVSDRSDGEVVADVRSRLRWDASVRGGLIDVVVTEGKVTLRGSVGSAAEKRRAAENAWVRGAKSVDAEGLQVDPWAPSRKLRKYPLAAPTDAEIRDAVRDAAAYDPRVRSGALDVRVDRGVVTVSGRAASVLAKRAAESIALNTVGVTDVKNELVVRPAREVPDEVLERTARSALLFHPSTDTHNIKVEAKQGRVKLTGVVDTFHERAEATDVIGRLQGVVEVENALTVKDGARPFVHRVHLEPYEPYWDSWYAPSKRSASDAEIAARIRAHLRWSPFVDADEVKVAVEQGRAVLSGTVDSWGERSAATSNAYEGGAVSVQNQLRVDTARD